MRKKIVPIILITLFSIILWGSVSLSEEYFTTYVMPLKVTNLIGNHTISNMSEKFVTVSVKGEGWTLAGMSLGPDLDFVVSSKDKLGRHKVNLSSVSNQNGWASSTIQIVEVKPDELSYQVEEVDSKKVKVVPNINVEFRPGYDIVSSVYVEPDSVEIAGPKSILNEMNEIFTDEIKLSNVSKYTSVTSQLYTTENISALSQDIRVEFDVQKIVDKVFDDVEVESRKVPPFRELKLFPHKIKIVLRGGINTLGKLTSDDLQPYITFNQALRDSVGVLVPVFEAPPFTKVIDVKPASLEYIIKKF